MASVRYANTNKSLLLVTLMILMTQVGYLENLNPWINGEETLDDAETVLETGGQGSANYSLAQSTHGEALALNAVMDPITFGYVEDADAATIYGNGSIWTVSSSSVLSSISPQRTTANNSMFSEDVFFFASGVCALSMHNISNGTTWEAFDVSGCTTSSQFYRSFFLLGQTFIFEIFDGTSKGQIWAHNVSNATTWRVGGGTYSNGAVRTDSALFQYGNDVWFYSTRQLYRINGSSFVVEQRSDFSGGSIPDYHTGWASSNGSIYFGGDPESVGRELYRHDVTSNQTYLVTDLNPSGDGVYSIRSVSDDVLWLRGRNSSSTGASLWVHNTTSNQTYQLSTISPSLSNVVVDDDVVYFYASTTGTGSEPHAYSLANNSTWLLKDIFPGSTGSSAPSTSARFASPLQAHNGLLYMLRDGGASQGDEEVWVYDPSTTETYRVSDIAGSDEVVNIIGAAGDTVYFTTEKTGYCCYMYAHSSTTNSTYELTNFPDGRYYLTGARFFLPINGTVYMNGDYQPSGLVAWSPDVLTTKATPVSGATCSVSPTLPSGLALNQGNCTVSGTPTDITSQTNYTLTATINGQTYGATFWLNTGYLPLTPSVADLDATVGAPIEPITFGIPTGAKAGDGGYDAPYKSNYSTMLAGDYHSCAVLGDGSMACWGDNGYRQLGDGTTTDRSTPVSVNLPAGSSVASIPAYAADHSCAILDNGSVYCWGLGSAFSTGSSVSTPQHLPLPAGRTPVSIQADHHSTCVILDNGSMMCVGGNTYNRLGYNGSATGTFAYVEYLPQGAIVVDMSLSENSACALLDDGDVWCWGYNSYEALGVSGGGTTYNYAVQPSIPSGNITAIEGHVRGHCSLYDNGSVACWGSNSNGERGIGNSSSANLATLGIQFTQPMPGNLPVTSIATGDHTVCALLSNGSVACWGDAYANGYSSDTNTPTLIPWPHGSVQATAISVGWYHGCALLENGSMWCWGQNSNGQLGDGTTTDSVSGTFVDLDQAAHVPFVSMSGATCSVDPALPAGLSMAQGNCTISGTPTGTSSTTTYTVYANTSAGTSRSEISITVVANPLFPSVDGAQLRVDQAMTNITFQYGVGPLDVSGATSCSTTPALPSGLSVDGSNCTISGTPTATAVNATYMVMAEISGTTYAAEIWLEVLGLIGPVVGVNNTLLPDVQPMYVGANLTYEVEPSLPASLSLDSATGVISGTPTETIANTTFTLYANDTNGDSLQWNISIEILEDTDGDGLPNLLPPDYDGENDDHRPTPGLTEDLDDDNDGLNDTNETDTGSYVDESDTGTNPLDPDTDDDGFCDGPIAIPGVCFAGPDPYPHDPNLPIDTDGDGLPDNDDDWDGPPFADEDDDGDGYPDTSEVACGSDPLDANSIPEDMDGDGICDGDDLDLDGDGIDNVNESGLPVGTLPNNPDTDGDGVCDGPVSPVTGNCTAGPDMFPLDPSAWNDTDGDGDPDELFPPSNSTPPLVEDLDDDNDGWSDIDEVNCGTDPLNASNIPVDLNGDGICDVLDLDWDDDGIPNANETDTGVYNDSSDTGTDPWNPDTDGDGFCDGPFAVFNETDTICIAGPDPFPHDPTLPLDTDGDGSPDELPEDYIGNLVEDTDDDNDGYSDVSELNCDSDPLNATSTPTNDLDGDGICDSEDDDVDGDGLSNESEQADGSLTSYSNADTDGDGICDGSIVPAMPLDVCVAGPDAFPDDAAAWLDTDGDGDPDELVDGMTTDLILDLDDDGDGWLDVDELICGSDSKDDMSTPVDGDNDGICDIMDTQTLAYSINDVEAEMFEAYVNQSDFVLLPNLTGMEAGTWIITPELPAGLTFSGTMARSGETGIISGIPTEASPMTNYTVIADNGLVNISFTFGLGVLEDTDGDRLPDEPSLTGLEEDLDDDNDGHLDEIEVKCGSDPLNQTSVPNVDEDGNCIEGKYADDDSDDDNGFLMCLLPFCLILLLALLLFALLFRDKVVLMGPEPENTTSDPSFLSGAGTKDDPFVLKPVKALKAGTTVEAKETISIVNMSPEIMVNLLDLAEAANDKRFRMYEVDGTTEEPGFNLEADDEGRLRLRFVFDDSDDPTYRGGTYNGLLKLGKASVYLSWTVEVKEDKNKMKQLRKEQEAAEKAEKEAKEAEDKAKAEAEAKEAEEKAKAAEEKAAKEAEEKAKAEEKAAAAAAKKAKEEEEAKAAKEAEEKAKSEAAAKEKAEKKPATTKEAKKQEELQRVKQRAKTIDFKVLGEAESSELKSEVKKGATTLEVANAKDFAESGSAEINDAKGSTIIAWTGKDGNTLTGVSGVTRVFAAKAVLMVKDDLQVIKGIGPFIEEKLNALGITTYRQLANMTAKLEDQVNEAIEFFPGRVKRDQWVNQAKILLGMDAKLDEKALKQAEELERIAQKAEGIDFGILGVASASEADDLQKIKGIGPFIAEKLNALGIYTFSQLANMTSEIEEEVNVAIEFFPGRVKRDEWAKQAKEFAKD